MRRLAAVAVLGLVLAAPAGAAVPWLTLADGASPGAPNAGTTVALALTRAAASRWSARLPSSASVAAAQVDYSKHVLAAIFGEFGCADGRVVVSSITQRGTTLAVTLVQRPLRPGMAECMAIFATFRLLSIPRSALHRPFPSRATVSFA